VASTTAHNGSYLAFNGGTGATPGSAWATFAPRNLSVSGRYELFLRLPAEDAVCWPRARNASVVVRGSGAYSHVMVDLDPGGDATSTDAVVAPNRRLAGAASEFPSGGSYVSLGEYSLLEGADVLVTLDTTYTGDLCMAVDNVRMVFVAALTSGCTDPLAENYDAVVSEDDGSCLYLGGRGVNTMSWSSMSSQFKLDNWYPVEEYDVWATGEYCDVPDGFGHDNETACWHDNCALHQQCGATSFCCVASKHHGCTPVHKIEDLDDEGWKLIFRHDINAAGYWDHGLWGVSDDAGSKDKFSLLDQLESFRRPGDGRFEFKMCWPESGFESCQHWIQLLNPMKNPDLTNMHTTCIDCPYFSDTDENGDDHFYGLLYGGSNHLLHGDQDGTYFRLGAETAISNSNDKLYRNAMPGPQKTNDDGIIEYPSVVELYVRPDFNGASCIDCKACYDDNGHVRMANFSLSGDSTKSYLAPACPGYCLDVVSPKQRAATLLATHQLVASTNGLNERPCEVIVSYDAFEESYYNQTICEGRETTVVGSMPTEMEFGKIGGVTSRAFFVAPRTANYTFNFKVNDGGELWLSPNADPRASRRLIALHSIPTDFTGEFTSSPGMDATVSSALCGEWACLGDRCFRAFGGHLTYDNAERACQNYGGHLGAPRSSAESALVGSIISAQGIGWHWLGLTDRNQESRWLYADGSYAGFDDMSSDHGWSYNGFSNTEPNDSGGYENCVDSIRSGPWNDADCFSTTLPFVCEIVDGCGGAYETEAIHMEKGEVRYLESIGYNDADSGQSLLTLTIDDGESFTTSEVLGLSGEFFRSIRTDGPVVDVSVNNIAAACNHGEDSNCHFNYMSTSTPRMETIEPPESTIGFTLITITGTGFSPRPSQNEVMLGGSACLVTRSNDTFVECMIPLAEGSAGTYAPSVKVFNKGFALNPHSLHHTVLMVIDSLTPTSGSLYGGMTLTLTGRGFAKFGLHNQIKLQLRNDSVRLSGNQVFLAFFFHAFSLSHLFVCL